MSAIAGMADDEALELVELLCFVADLCEAHHDVVSVALSHFVGTGYDAGDLADDAARLGGALARAVGCADMLTGRTR